MSIQLLIADDHALIREGLRGAFEDTDIEIVGEATSAYEAIRLALATNADVMLLDIKMPDKDGFEVLRLVKSQKPDLAILIYSQYDRLPYKTRARELSASGYLNKRILKRELIDAIQRVSCGEELWVSESVDAVSTNSPFETAKS
jgi:two-component system invasion response regulator UvrY